MNGHELKYANTCELGWSCVFIEWRQSTMPCKTNQSPAGPISPLTNQGHANQETSAAIAGSSRPAHSERASLAHHCKHLQPPQSPGHVLKLELQLFPKIHYITCSRYRYAELSTTGALPATSGAIYHWPPPVMKKYRHAGSVVMKLCISNWSAKINGFTIKTFGRNTR